MTMKTGSCDLHGSDPEQVVPEASPESWARSPACPPGEGAHPARVPLPSHPLGGLLPDPAPGAAAAAKHICQPPSRSSLWGLISVAYLCQDE